MMISMDDVPATLLSPPAIVVRAGKSIESDPIDFVFWLHMLTPLENRLSDAMLARHALNSKPDPDIVIVDIDEPSLRGLERRVEPAARGGDRKSEHFRTNRI